MKPKVLLVIDTPNWAFKISADDMVKYMPDFDFTILGYNDNLKNPKHNLDQYDLVYLFGHYMDKWVPDKFNFKKSCAGIRAEFGYVDNLKNPKQDPALAKAAEHILRFPAIHVVSDKLYSKFKEFHPNTYNICHGVDVNFFTQKHDYSKKSKMVIGWAGSPYNPYKNINVLRAVVSKRNDVILKETHCDKNGNAVSNREQMREFYHSLDFYCLPSKTEGTSATMLEAMACGLPIIATPTGGWIELYQKTKGGILVAGNETSVNHGISEMLKLSEDELFKMGRDNRKEMLDHWRWEIKAKEFTKFFNDCIEMSNDKLSRTKKCFAFKWDNMEGYGFSKEHREFFVKWTIKKYGLKDVEELNDFYKSKKNILEVGCGSCFNIAYMSENTDAKITGVDLCEQAIAKGKEIFKDKKNISILNADLFKLPFQDGSFDLIIADGVLHHTMDTKKALFAIYKKLAIGGHLYCYLYKKMGDIREFTNDLVREKMSKMTPEQALEYCKPITEMAQSLAKFKEKIKIPYVDILGLPEGEYLVQEIMYYGIMKSFWNDRFSFEENQMNNFDWYYPAYAHRQTKEQVESWLKELDCEYSFNDSNPNGLSILLKRVK